MSRIDPADAVIVPSATEVVRNRDVHYPFRQDSDFRYLTAFPEPDAVAVLLPGRAQGEFVLFCRERDPEQETWNGRRAGLEGAVRDYGADEAFAIDRFSELLPELLAGRRCVHISLGEHPEIDDAVTSAVRQIRELSRRGPAAPERFAALDATLHEMRLRKSAEEVEIMRTAARVSAAAHRRAMAMAASGVFEYQVAAEIHHEFARHGMEPGYGSIVAGGDNACILHYTSNDMPLRDGDLLLIDAGGEYQGYTADITRTFPVNGRYTGPQRAIYEVVLAAQRAAIDTLRPGNPSDLPHRTAVRVLTEGMVSLGLLHGDVEELIETGAYRRYFMHGTGHWLGMDVHDVGRYRLDGQPRPFEPGMVMTVEPGIYVPAGDEQADARFRGIGIRIEDDILVTEAGPENLTADVPVDPDEIEALIREARGR